MFGFGFGKIKSLDNTDEAGHDSSDEEEAEEYNTDTPPWLKKQKLIADGNHGCGDLSMEVEISESGLIQGSSGISQFTEDNKHIQAVKIISQQLQKYRIDRALKSMKVLPNFERDFNKFVRDECRRQADIILNQKDPPVNEFNTGSLEDFDYNKELVKLQNVVPTFMASIAGTVSSSRDEPTDLTRKGFGGSRQSDDISLVPVMVQTATCILRNRHPNCISTIPCINSVNNYLNHITKQYFFLQNSLGFSYRLNLRQILNTYSYIMQ